MLHCRYVLRTANNTMPGGIGSVPPESRIPEFSKGVSRDLPASASELHMFYHLSHWRVFYNKARRMLYFSTLDHSPIYTIIERFARKHQLTIPLETLYLDPHHYFFGGYRVKLPDIVVAPLLIALRLEGITISQKLDELTEDQLPSGDTNANQPEPKA